MTHANNFGADQSAHMRRLICAIVVRCPDGKTSKCALANLLILLLLYVAEQSIPVLTGSQPPQTISRRGSLWTAYDGTSYRNVRVIQSRVTCGQSLWGK